MGKDFWLGEDAGPKYKAPAYDTAGATELGERAGRQGKEWGSRMRQEAEGSGYWGDQQRAFGETLLGAAEGTAPSAAELQMRAGLDQATAQGSALSRSMPGLSPAMAMRAAQQAQQGNAMQTVQQTGVLRADEQARAREAYSQFMGRAQQLKQQYLSMGMNAEQAALAAQMEMERQRQQAWATQQQATAGSVTGGTPGFLSNLAEGAATVGTTALLVSDRRQKKDIKKASPEAIEKFAEALEGYSFNYKEDAPTSDSSKKKKHWGVMVQDLEAKGGAVGKSVVDTYTEPAQKAEKGREVKAMDMQATLGAALAAIGNVHSRLKKLED